MFVRNLRKLIIIHSINHVDTGVSSVPVHRQLDKMDGRLNENVNFFIIGTVCEMQLSGISRLRSNFQKKTFAKYNVG